MAPTCFPRNRWQSILPLMPDRTSLSSRKSTGISWIKCGQSSKTAAWRLAPCRCKSKKKGRKSPENRRFRDFGGDGEIRTLAGFNTPTAFRERTLQPLGYISICFQPVFRQKIRYSVVWKAVSIFLASARKNPPGKSRKGLHRAGFRERDGEMTVGISSRSRYDLFDTSPCCIPNALRVSLTNRAERRKRRTKRRKTVDMKLLKSVDEPESPEVPRGSEVGSSTNPHDFESLARDKVQ